MDILRIARALRDIAEALEEQSPPEKETTSSEAVAPPFTPDEIQLKDLQNQAADLLRAKRKPQLMGILKEFGLPNLSSAHPKDFPALLAALKGIQDA